MKKIILLLLTLMQFSCSSQSKDVLTFKVQFKPEMKYSLTIEQTSHSDLKYSGPEEILQILKDKGVQNPTIDDNVLNIESVYKTGKLIDGAGFPLTVELVKIAGGDGRKVIPDGVLFYGHCSIGNMPTLDSVVSGGLNEDFKKVLIQAIQSMFSQVSLPEKTVKVGESFSIESPLSIPIAGLIMEMTITTNYKLLSISDDLANFDVSQVYTMKTTNTKYTNKATGSGKGKLLYDISNNFYRKYQFVTEMEMNMKIDNIDLDLNSKGDFIQTIKITKN